MARAAALIDGHGEIVAEYFDVGQSRSLPWKRRPQASLLLAALADRDRGFDAVVVGEPHRAFYGNQYSLTMPVFEHYGVALWVPEVGGPIDPTSEAHDMIMSVFGGMSKGERNRIKIRVRSAMQAQTKVEGRYLGGRPPYGYRLADAGPHPNPGKAADGRRLHRLEPDPATAPVVVRIFERFLAGAGVFAIAEGLTADGIPCPSANDRARNRHREGLAWSKGAIRTILSNPRYTGHEIWGKQRKEDVLLDVDDVALGYETKFRWNSTETWVWSTEQAHPAIIDIETFTQAQTLRAARRIVPPSERGQRRDTRRYLFRGMLHCGLCTRKMQGNWINGKAHYRCRYPQEYALVNHVHHPSNVYLREAAIVRPLDDWLFTRFAPHHVADTIDAMTQAQAEAQEEDDPRRSAAQRQVAECDRKLARYRSVLDAGADETTVVGWIAETTAQRAAAQAVLATRSRQARPRLSRQEIADLVERFDDLRRVLRDADPEDKAKVYAALGVRLTYKPSERRLLVAATPAPRQVGVKVVSEGGLGHYAHALNRRTSYPARGLAGDR
ncbi:recombinase family protein [Parafrankia sp. EUN1f]|uniref:recombinase family protein n=1 Tax=Parafrankia sp. EUN1f TaxID=102897 RepID=UPI0001C43FA7|nr:recombinase family protein [Parafrankia sp. EUN1f]EFC79203.1 Recombinase [Parafrankia sp. EUN1f]